MVCLTFKDKCDLGFFQWKTILYHFHKKAKEFSNWPISHSSFILESHPYTGTEAGIRLFVDGQDITSKFFSYSVNKNSQRRHVRSQKFLPIFVDRVIINTTELVKKCMYLYNLVYIQLKAPSA